MPAIDPIIAALVQAQPWYVVLRPLAIAGDRVRGEVIDSREFIAGRADALVEARYLYQLPFGMEPPDPDHEGRRMLPVENLETLARVRDQKRPTPTIEDRKEAS